MNVTCAHCENKFDVPAASAGNIDYGRCKSVFRVAFRLRTPCPACKKIVRLTPKGAQIVGVPLEWVPDEPTEQFDDDLDVPPTVKVNVPQMKFRYLEKERQRPKPFHMALRPVAERPKPFPWFKALVFSVLFVSALITAALTYLALQPRTKHATVPNTEQENKLRRTIPTPPPQGGPEKDEEVLEVQPEPPQKTIKMAKLLLPPVRNLTSSFGVRKDPFRGHNAFHGGIDLEAKFMAEVSAALDGVVTFSGKHGGYGNVIAVKHKQGYETRYAHLARTLVKKGDRLKRGDLIGLVGSSGRSTGNHLHFELRKNGKTIDPLKADFELRSGESGGG